MAIPNRPDENQRYNGYVPPYPTPNRKPFTAHDAREYMQSVFNERLNNTLEHVYDTLKSLIATGNMRQPFIISLADYVKDEYDKLNPQLRDRLIEYGYTVSFRNRDDNIELLLSWD